jgi:hypothetical protein
MWSRWDDDEEDDQKGRPETAREMMEMPTASMPTRPTPQA